MLRMAKCKQHFYIQEILPIIAHQNRLLWSSNIQSNKHSQWVPYTVFQGVTEYSGEAIDVKNTNVFLILATTDFDSNASDCY